jgi:hypothetical protein
MGKDYRPSPSAHAGDWKGKIKRGNDGWRWISLPDKNGVYHWKRLKDMSDCDSAEEYYRQFPDYKGAKFEIRGVLKKLGEVKKDLRKKGIYMVGNVGWGEVYNFVDNAWSEAEEKLLEMKKIENMVDEYRKVKKVKYASPMHVVSFLFWSDLAEYEAKRDGYLNIQHNMKDKSDRDVIVEVMKKHFGADFIWKGSAKKVISVKLKRKSKIEEGFFK